MPRCSSLVLIAEVSRWVTQITENLTGDRSGYPWLVADLTQNALEKCGLPSRLMYGFGAWIEVLEDGSLVWAGSWKESSPHFWVETTYQEIVDLNTSVSHRVRFSQKSALKSLYSPPILWSQEVPKFYQYLPLGFAQFSFDNRNFQRLLSLGREKIAQEVPSFLEQKLPLHRLSEEALSGESQLSFINEPILISGKKVLENTHQTFSYFDRALSVATFPEPPFADLA